MSSRKLKIAIIVHGRFHAFHLAQALIDHGNTVVVFTNYPYWAVRRFGIPRQSARSFWIHGICARVSLLLHNTTGLFYPEAWLHTLFGRWAAREVVQESWDIVHCWSGVSEEVLRAMNGKAVTILMRGSSHVRIQDALLEEEFARTAIALDRPSPWMIAREEREYSLANYIMVLSSFARQSFLTQHVEPRKLLLLLLGVSVKSFYPASHIVAARRNRLISGEPLRILYVGTFSLRKGMWDMGHIIEALQANNNFRFRLVGALTNEAAHVLHKFGHAVEIVPKQPQHNLPQMYAWADIFIFPTIEDGYPVVLAQAQGACLPIISTTNSSAPDIIEENKTGWVVPIRAPQQFVQRLLWIDEHRSEVADMIHHMYCYLPQKDWSCVAKNFITMCIRVLEKE